MSISENVAKARAAFKSTMDEIMETAHPKNESDFINSFLSDDSVYKNEFGPIDSAVELYKIVEDVNDSLDNTISSLVVYYHRDYEKQVDIYFAGVEEYHGLNVMGKDASWYTYTPRMIAIV